MQDPENPEVADVYGHYGFAVFWTVPAVGDVLNRLSGLGGFGSVRVLSRHFFLHERVERSWWVLMVEEVQEDPRLAALNAEIVQSFDEDEAAVRAEIDKRTAESLKRLTARKRKP